MMRQFSRRREPLCRLRKARVAGAAAGFRPHPLALGCVAATKPFVHMDDYDGDPAYRRAILAPLTSARAWREFERSSRCRCSRRKRMIGAIGIYRQRSGLHRQADRAGHKFCRPSRHRHREHAAAQRAARIRCSSRPPPPTCSKSSAARRSICRPCSIRFPSWRCAYARRTMRGWPGVTAKSTGSRRGFGHAKEEHAAIIEFFLQHPFSPGRGTVIGRTALEGRPVHVVDYFADPELEWRVEPQWREAQRIGKYRTALGVPLLREGVPIGVLAMTRSYCQAVQRQADRAGRPPSPIRR